MEIKFIFDNGRVYIEKIRVILIPINIAVLLYQEILKISLISDKKIEQIIKSSIIIKIIKEFKYNYNLTNKIGEIDFLKKNLQLLSKFGFGELELVYFKYDKIIIRNKNPNFYNLSQMIFEENLINKLNLFESIISEIVSIIGINIVEFKINHKLNQLYYNIKFKSNPNKNLNINNLLENQKRYYKNKNYQFKIIGNTLNKVYSQKHIKNKNGIIKLWNVQLIAMPFEILNFFKKKDLKKINKNNLDSILFNIKEIAKGQALLATKMQKKIFGINDKIIILKIIIHQSELIGLGNITNLEINKTKIKFNLFNSLDFNSIISNYFLNLIKYVIEYLFQKKTIFEIDIKKNLIIYKILSTKSNLNEKYESKFFKLISKNRLFEKN